jgi:hypothetical protein
MQAVEWLAPRRRDKTKGDIITLQQRLLFASSLHNPFMPALYRSVRGGVKKHSIFSAIKAAAWCDLQSRKKRGAAGGGAGRSWAWGDGGVDIRGALQGPELLVIVSLVIAPVDSPKGSISPSTLVP